MNVVQLAMADINKVLEVQSELAIADELSVCGETLAQRGLLISGHTREDLEKHLSTKGHIFGVFEGDDLIGYVFVAPAVRFSPKYQEASVTCRDAPPGGDDHHTGDDCTHRQRPLTQVLRETGIYQDLRHRLPNVRHHNQFPGDSDE